MIATEDLIGRLAENAGPVRRLASPGMRALQFTGVGLLLFGGLCAWQGLRADLPLRLGQITFCLSLAGALLTGGLAALSAAVLSVPGRASAWLLLPLPALLLWLASVGRGCLGDWIVLRADQVHRAEVIECVMSLLLTAIPLTAAMLVLRRRAAPILLWPATVAGGLATAGLVSAAMTLIHPHDASVMVLLWNFGVLGLVLLGHLALGRFAVRPHLA